MGRYLFLMVTGLMLLFNTVALKLDKNRVNLAEANGRSLAFAKARNLATSGAYMAVSKLSLDNTWKEGFPRLSLGGAVGKVWVDDHHSNSSLSSTEKLVTSVAVFDDVSETTTVSLDVPPDLARFAIYASGDVENINVYNERGFKDASLLVENTGVMPPFDWDALKDLARAQDAVDGSSRHIISGRGGACNDDDHKDDDHEHGHDHDHDDHDKDHSKNHKGKECCDKDGDGRHKSKKKEDCRDDDERDRYGMRDDDDDHDQKKRKRYDDHDKKKRGKRDDDDDHDKKRRDKRDDDHDKKKRGKRHDDDHDSSDDKKDSRNSFYFKNKVPNVTVVYGDLKISGNTTIYGIYVVYGDVIIDGNVHIEGIIAMPDPGEVVMHGGGNRRKMNITGGMFINADAKGTGNHISVKYDPTYMSIFSNWQKKSGIIITRWLESPAI